MYSSNPRRVGIYKSYTWASIHMGSIYTNIMRKYWADIYIDFKLLAFIRDSYL